MAQKKNALKQKGLGYKPSPNYYQTTVHELLHISLVTRSNYM